LRCGGRDPTKYRKRNYCGFREYPGGVFAYPPWGVRISHFLVGFSLALLVAMFMYGQILGNERLTTNLVSMVSTKGGLGQNVMDAVKSGLPGVETWLTAVGSTVLAPFLVSINMSLTTGGLYLPNMTQDLVCLNASFQNLPNIPLGEVREILGQNMANNPPPILVVFLTTITRTAHTHNYHGRVF